MRASDETGHGDRAARAAVATTFAVHAVMAGTLGPWIPSLKAGAGLDPGGLGLALAAFAGGLVVGTRLADPATRRVGGRALIRIAIPALGTCLVVLPLAESLAALSGAFLAFGLVSGLIDVAMNAEAVDVEARFGRPIMSVLHGTWSVCVFVGAALAAVGVAAGIPIELHVALVAIVLVAVSAPMLSRLPVARPPSHEDPVAASAGRSRGRIAALCLLAAAAFLTEGIAVDWSAVYLRESIGAAAGTAGLAVVAFSAGMAVSRFAGDRVAARVGAARLARAGAAAGAVVLVAALAVGGAAASIVALGILGLGLGPIVPFAFRAAGGIGRAPGRTALSVVVTAGYVGSILGPVAFGFLADGAGFATAFAVPIIACAAAVATAQAIRG
ncbi:MAG TPA: MFS transporter [Actinomycetota bacterium]